MASKGIALIYEGDIPQILAKAEGTLLKKMLEIASKYNIPIIKDGETVEVLKNLPIGSEIPEELYAAVSKILAYCYNINLDFRKKIIGKYKNNV